MSPKSTPRRPKRPSTAYNIFFREEHARIKTAKKPKCGSLAASQSSIDLVVKRWNSLSHEEKLHFQTRAARDKVRYAKELGRWWQVQDPVEKTLSNIKIGVQLQLRQEFRAEKSAAKEVIGTNANHLEGYISSSSIDNISASPGRQIPRSKYSDDSDPLKNRERIVELAEALGDEGVSMMIRLFS
eukprot:scaffold2917_cov191-Amphora_coffeaeformis.AAC.47